MLGVNLVQPHKHWAISTDVDWHNSESVFQLFQVQALILELGDAHLATHQSHNVNIIYIIIYIIYYIKYIPLWALALS